MLHRREVTHILPEGSIYRDLRQAWNLDVSASLGSSQQVSSESPHETAVSTWTKKQTQVHTLFLTPFNKDSVGRLGIKFVSHNAFQNLTILPPHTHSSFPCFSSLEVTPTSSILLSHAFSKPSHHAQPHLMSGLNEDHLLFLPGILNISPLNSSNCSQHPFNPRRVSFQEERFAVATDMGDPRANPPGKHETDENSADSAWVSKKPISEEVAEFFSCLWY